MAAGRIGAAGLGREGQGWAAGLRTERDQCPEVQAGTVTGNTCRRVPGPARPPGVDRRPSVRAGGSRQGAHPGGGLTRADGGRQSQPRRLVPAPSVSSGGRGLQVGPFSRRQSLGHGSPAERDPPVTGRARLPRLRRRRTRQRASPRPPSPSRLPGPGQVLAEERSDQCGRRGSGDVEVRCPVRAQARVRLRPQCGRAGGGRSMFSPITDVPLAPFLSETDRNVKEEQSAGRRGGSNGSGCDNPAEGSGPGLGSRRVTSPAEAWGPAPPGLVPETPRGTL